MTEPRFLLGCRLCNKKAEFSELDQIITEKETFDPFPERKIVMHGREVNLISLCLVSTCDEFISCSEGRHALDENIGILIFTELSVLNYIVPQPPHLEIAGRAYTIIL